MAKIELFETAEALELVLKLEQTKDPSLGVA